MRSFTALTEEIDDLETGVEELAAQIAAGGELAKNSCGIVFCDYDLDGEELARCLKKRFPFPVIGVTGAGVITKERSFSDGAIALTVLTADDCCFQPMLVENDSVGGIEESYRCLPDNGAPARVVFAFAAHHSCIDANAMMAAFDRLTGGLPVFGGWASDDWSFEYVGVLADGGFYRDRVVYMRICGNVHPQMVVSRGSGEISNFRKKVTKAEGRVVYELDGRGFVDVLQEVGLGTFGNEVARNFLGTPFLVAKKTAGGDEFSVMRVLKTLDRETNSGIFLADVPEDSEISITQLNHDEVVNTAQHAIDNLLANIEGNAGGAYSTVFCVTCAARYSLILPDKEAEARLFGGKLAGLNMMGFYSFGEFCPVGGRHSGKMYNAAHNETFALMAL